MSEYTRRALRAVVAAAAMATIGMSLIGTAAAAPHSGNDNIGSNSSSDNNQSTSANSGDNADNNAPGMPLDTNKGTPTPGVHNKLMNVEVPKFTTASYSGSWGTLAAQDSDDQSDDAGNPPADSMLSHNPQGDLSQTGDAPSTDTLLGGLGGASKSPAPSSNLNQMNGYQVGTSKI
jgi:hypothetical protein